MTSCVLPSQLLPAGCGCLQAWCEQEQQQWQPCCWQQLELELQAAGRRGRPTGDWQVLLRAPLQQLQQLWRLRLQVGACTAHSRGLRRPPFTAGYVVIGAVAVSLNSSGSCGCRWVGRVVTHAAAAEGAVVAAAAGTTVIPQLHKLCPSCAQHVLLQAQQARFLQAGEKPCFLRMWTFASQCWVENAPPLITMLLRVLLAGTCAIPVPHPHSTLAGSCAVSGTRHSLPAP